MYRRSFSAAIALATVIMASGGGSLSAQAAHIETAAQQASDPGAPQIDAQDVERFLDGAIAGQMSIDHIPGATVAVVKDGQVVLVKGYGTADVAAGRPVDGQTTLFRIASITKLFVWTAVMQQVEQGKIDLHADVNTYLKTFRIPDAFGKPITMLNLMTHTAGFEDGNRDSAVATPDRLQPLAEYLPAHVPARIYPPGTVSAYSNYGAALAAYVVQQVSGMPFEDYVEQHIFAPLAMTHSSIRQPLQAALQPDMAVGYSVDGGQPSAGPFDLLNVYPAGAISTTAGDMTHFMIAHLADGEYNGARILRPETAQLMHSPAWTPSPEMAGMAHGFFAMTINGQPVIRHGGDFNRFHSELTLIPGQKIGLFVAYNGSSGGSAGDELVRAFMDRYFPAPPRPSAPPADFKTRLGSYLGEFELARHNTSTVEKITGLLQPITVSAGPDDTLLMTSLRGEGGLDKWVEVKPGVFGLAGGDDKLIFLDQAGGQYQTAYLASLPSIGLLRTLWYEGSTLNALLLSVCLVLFLSGVLAAPVGLFGLRVQAPPDEPARRLRLAARWTGFGFGLWSTGYVVAAAVIYTALSNSPANDFGPLDTLVWVARLGVLGALALIPLAYLAWKNRYWSLAGRIHYTLIALAAWGWIGFELVWRMLG